MPLYQHCLQRCTAERKSPKTQIDPCLNVLQLRIKAKQVALHGTSSSCKHLELPCWHGTACMHGMPSRGQMTEYSVQKCTLASTYRMPQSSAGIRSAMLAPALELGLK